jgi:hypothetical protein
MYAMMAENLLAWARKEIDAILPEVSVGRQ